MTLISAKTLSKPLFFLILPCSILLGSQNNNLNLNQNRVNQDNRRLREEGLQGEFRYDNNGNYLFINGGGAPAWAIENECRNAGLNPEYGTAGINPFKMYSYDEFKNTDHYYYFHSHWGLVDPWEEGQIDEKVKVRGREILLWAGNKAGKDAMRRITDVHAAEVERKVWWYNLINRQVPALAKKALEPKIFGAMALIITIVCGLGFGFWHFSGYFFRWIFTSRPKILGPKDSDIYGGFFKSLTFKHEKLPKVIVNEDLQKRLKEVVEDNKAIAKHNRPNWRGQFPARMWAYRHMLIWGPPGTGKTLFCKKLAKRSGMHFMRFSAAKLVQMGEEEAVQELNKLFQYARAHGPTVLIIEEANTLFDGRSEKVAQLQTLFQQEFDKTNDSRVQIAMLTNYPNDIDKAILRRCGRRIKFDLPNYKTQIKLFNLHFKLQCTPKVLATLKGVKLTAEDLESLTGSDIETISIAYARSRTKGVDVLRLIIAQHKEDWELISNAFSKNPLKAIKRLFNKF